MLKYIIKRLLLFLPTLLVISLLAFGLSHCTPGDPIHCYLPESVDGQFTLNPQQYERAYHRKATELGWDKPIFYVQLTSVAYPDTLHRVVIREKRQTLERLIDQYGNWPLIQDYFRSIDALSLKMGALPDSIGKAIVPRIRHVPGELYLRYQTPRIESALDTLSRYVIQDEQLNQWLGSEVQLLQASFRQMIDQPSRHRLYLPALYWHGLDNQYHRWISHFLSGDLGRSCRDGRPIFGKILSHLKWTLIINGLAILIAYLLSIPLGVYAALYRGSRFDRFSSLVLFFLYSMPNFWVATLLVIFLTNSTYGMDWFPATGLGQLSSQAPFWDRFAETASHLVLPVFSLSYGLLAFISRQMRGSVLEAIRSDYIRTARAKGLDEHTVVWKHAFRNALFPLITLFAGVLPGLLAGSIIIEQIFSIPGMGFLLIQSITTKDWLVVYAILMMAAVVTIIGILIADILYAWADPRVSYGKTQTEV